MFFGACSLGALILLGLTASISKKGWATYLLVFGCYVIVVWLVRWLVMQKRVAYLESQAEAIDAEATPLIEEYEKQYGPLGGAGSDWNDLAEAGAFLAGLTNHPIISSALSLVEPLTGILQDAGKSKAQIALESKIQQHVAEHERVQESIETEKSNCTWCVLGVGAVCAALLLITLV